MDAVELLRKIKKLEESHARLTHQIISNHLPSQMTTTETQFQNILESMARAAYMFDVNTRIIYWNQQAQSLYGYTPAEALGKTAPEIIIGPRYSELATLITQRAVKGETWSGQFPVRTKSGETFAVIATLAPCRDHNGTTFGVTCVCADARQFRPPTALLHSKISNLATKVKLRMNKTGGGGGGDIINMQQLHDHDSDPACSMPTTEGSVFSLRSELAWMRISWPWKLGNNNNNNNRDITNNFGCNNNNDQEYYSGPQTSWGVESEDNSKESSSCSYSSPSSSWSIGSSIHIFENMEDVEISWDDLTIGQQIWETGSHGSGTVYHALLYGSEVAVKIFTKQEYPNDLILSFRKEVCLMKRLRHPNILLFMGAVISPQYLCIVTEFLPRGSLFRLLQHSTKKLDWRRRVQMAVDIAQGMNYLHNCQPPIVHRNLKSSNVLVDKNWTQKVGDFGLSSIKHGTYLKTNTGTGTPHWMAPEVLRNEQVDEKSDVYSYGVVLWEITTGKIPWENLNTMQVIGAVGFMNQRLEMPDDVDPQWASLIEICWSSDPRSRPTFREILSKLKDLQKKFSRAPLAAKRET